MNWQPIETLWEQPWVGYVLACHYDSNAGVWAFQIVDWCGDRLFHNGDEPTHWAPLTPPEATDD
jgi:hypothetical protein